MSGQDAYYIYDNLECELDQEYNNFINTKCNYDRIKYANKCINIINDIKQKCQNDLEIYFEEYNKLNDSNNINADSSVEQDIIKLRVNIFKLVSLLTRYEDTLIYLRQFISSQ